MEKSNDFGPFLKLTQVLVVITKILNIISVVTAFITLGAGILLSVFSGFIADAINQTIPGSMTLDFGNLSLRIPEGVLNGEQIMTVSIPLLIEASVALAVLFFITRHLLVILKDVLDKRPFSGEGVVHLRQLGIWIMLSSLQTGLHGLILNYQLGILGFNDLTFMGSKIPVNLNINVFDGSLLFVGLLILLLSRIFQYGSFLQEEYDATL